MDEDYRKKLEKDFKTLSFIPEALVRFMGDKGGELYRILYRSGEMTKEGYTKDEVAEYAAKEISKVTGLPLEQLSPYVLGLLNGVIDTMNSLYRKLFPPDPCPLKDGNVTIGKYSFYAEDIQADPPYRKRIIDEVKIEGSTPRHYLKGYELRKVTFTARVNCPVEAVQKKLNELHGKPVAFTSKETGAFNAYVNYKLNYPAGTVDYVEVEFEVMETTAEIPKPDKGGG